MKFTHRRCAVPSVSFNSNRYIAVEKPEGIRTVSIRIEENDSPLEVITISQEGARILAAALKNMSRDGM